MYVNNYTVITSDNTNDDPVHDMHDTFLVHVLFHDLDKGDTCHPYHLHLFF